MLRGGGGRGGIEIPDIKILDERKNEVNGSNKKINQSDILLILFSQGLNGVSFPTS